MPKGKSSVQRTLELLNAWSWYPWRVENFNAFSGKKKDLYYIIDYIAITDSSTIGIQVCGADFASHVRKLTEDELENTIKWLKNPNRKLLLIGWRKVLLRRGLKRMVYKPRIAWFYIWDNKLIMEEKDTAEWMK